MSGAARLPRGRRWAIRALLVAGTLCAVLGIFAVWADRQLLDAGEWAETSTQMLANEQIRTAVASYAVDQVYANVPVDAELAQALPPRLKPLAGPAAGGLRTLGERVVTQALGRPRLQEAWRTANRATARQFIAVAEDESPAITASGEAVVLDLRVVLLDVVARLGLPGSLSARIPEGAGRVEVMSGGEVRTVQNVATTVRVFAVLFPLLAVAALAAAVALARGRRRTTLLAAGFALVAAGLLVLVGRRLVGGWVVDALAETASVRPAAEAAWSISTRLLRDVAQSAVILGIPVILAAWLAGPTRAATWLRRAAAPWLRERPGVAYAVVGALVLLVIAWGPIPATREALPLLLMLVLVVVGVEALRRQTAREFPDAALGELRLPSLPWPARAGGATAAPGALPAAPVADGNGAGGAGAADHVALLERLAALHDRGALTDEEFAAEKAALARTPAA